MRWCFDPPGVPDQNALFRDDFDPIVVGAWLIRYSGSGNMLGLCCSGGNELCTGSPLTPCRDRHGSDVKAGVLVSRGFLACRADRAGHTGCEHKGDWSASTLCCSLVRLVSQ